MACSRIKPNSSKVCIANFDKKIILQYPASIANNNPNQNADSSFTQVKEVWAMVKTLTGADSKNDTNINNSVTTDFYIRYDSAIDLEKTLWVQYNSLKYKISSKENIDLKNETIRLRSIKRGDINQAGNLR